MDALSEMTLLRAIAIEISGKGMAAGNMVLSPFSKALAEFDAVGFTDDYVFL